MSERWTCPACSTRNEAVNFTCQRCGRAQGMSIESEQQVGQGPIATQRPVRRRSGARSKGWIGFIWIPVVAGFFIVPYFTESQRASDGMISRAGSMSVHDLRVGDCFDFNDNDADEVDTVRGIPCDQPHDNEVFAASDMASGPFPGDLEFEIAFETICLANFATYVGAYYQDSEIWADMLVPLPEGWAEGDRRVTCYLYAPEGEIVTGSLQGSGR
jgi:hypothetical protein